MTMALTATLLAVWAIRLWAAKLVGRYRVLFIYLVWSAALGAYGLVVFMNRSTDREAYNTVYFLHRYTDWALSAALLVEIFGRSIEVSPAIARAGKWFANFAFGLALLAGVGVAAVTVTDGQSMLKSWPAYEEAYYIGLLILTGLMIGFLLLFRVREPRNLLVLGGVFGFLFGSAAILWLTRSPASPQNLWFQGVYILGLAVGAALMSRDGEKRPDADIPAEVLAIEPELMDTLRSTTEALHREARSGGSS